VAPVLGVVDLTQALRAGGEIGWDGHAPLAAGQALHDLEPLCGLGRDGLRAHLAHLGGRRPIRLDPAEERRQGRRAPEGLDGDARRLVPDATHDPFLAREPVEPGSETDSLNGPAHLDPATFAFHDLRLQAWTLPPTGVQPSAFTSF
jgi:hypothetical protein